jgi:hypothetical protein
MTARSEAASSPLVGSSSSSTEASRRIALASATRRRCPPDSRTPPSPIWVFHPSGSCWINACTRVALAAASSSSRVAPGRPKATLSATVPSSIHGS